MVHREKARRWDAAWALRKGLGGETVRVAGYQVRLERRGAGDAAFANGSVRVELLKRKGRND